MWIKPIYNLKTKRVIAICAVCIGLVYFGNEIRLLKKEVSKVHHLPAQSTARIKAITSALKKSPDDFAAVRHIPSILKHFPFGEEMGIVLGVKEVAIRGVIAPYNASIIEEDGHYLLFFRYDIINKDKKQLVPFYHDNKQQLAPFFSYVGCVELDENFNQTDKPFKRIDTLSRYSEDPRIIRMDQQYYLIYNDLLPSKCFCRTMRVAKLNLATSKVDFVTSLDQHIKPVEKNWMPFVYQLPNGKPEVHFVYEIYPHKVIGLKDPKVNECTQYIFAGNPTLHQLPWQRIWGPLKGGTAPRLIGEEYLTFFHSAFKDKNGLVWYVMGAYTFEAHPPFRITRMSPHPILFKGIYNTKTLNTANPKIKDIYPAGFAFENRDGRELIHLSCGENDSSVKVITFDKAALLQSLKKIE